MISFSGEMDPNTGERKQYDQQDAWLEVPLTHNYARAKAAVRGILARGPHGGTNFAAGMRLAVRELAGLSGAKSPPREGARKMVFDFGDLDFMSSAGLRVVLVAGKRMREAKGKLAFAGLRDNVHDVFAMSGFLKLFQAHKTLDEAIAAMQ